MSGSEWDDVVTYRVTGTETQVKKHLASLVRAAKKEDDSFDYGDTTEKKVTRRDDGVLYAGATFSDHHDDYTATPEEEPKILR